MRGRIYLSGPITGVPNYKKDFEVVKIRLTQKGHCNIVNPAELDGVISNGEYEEYMNMCFALMDMCDVIVLLPGWEKSSGANRELGYAIGKSKRIFIWDEECGVLRDYGKSDEVYC